MKKLERQFLRREFEPGYEKETWKPRWNCFCCHDTGFVLVRLVHLVIPNYESGKDKFPMCQNPGCLAAREKIGQSIYSSLDFRFDPELCAKLDALERQDWRETRAKWHSLRQNPQPPDFSKVVKNLRGGDRDETEQYEAERRHEEVKER
jgi:hypothetical protein